MSGGTQILKKKMTINFGATLDPYALDNNNRRIDKLNINNGGSLFRLASASINMSYSLNNDSFKRSGDKILGIFFDSSILMEVAPILTLLTFAFLSE